MFDKMTRRQNYEFDLVPDKTKPKACERARQMTRWEWGKVAKVLGVESKRERGRAVERVRV